MRHRANANTPVLDCLVEVYRTLQLMQLQNP
jgi:hypothetical protein